MNKVFTAVNTVVLVFVIIAGFIKGDIDNWYISEDTILNITTKEYELYIYFFTFNPNTIMKYDISVLMKYSKLKLK